MREGWLDRAPGLRAVAVLSVLLPALASLAPALAQEETPAEPLDIDQTEKVEVRMILLDVYVLDRAGRTAPGLTAEDFVVKLDGRKVKVATLDADCPIGVAADPGAGDRLPRVAHAIRTEF